jgi:hypothetical protein
MGSESGQFLISRVAVVIPSCDEYSDLWASQISSLRLRWSACPFEICLISNYVRCAERGISAITVGVDRGWAANLMKGLAAVPSDYVLLFLDDLYLTKDVDNEKLTQIIRCAVACDWEYLRLNPTPPPPTLSSAGAFAVGRIPAGDHYRASTVLTLWKKSVLLDVLNPHENAWQFEIFGSQRTDKYEEWFACSSWNLPYDNLVVKGKVDPRALRRIKSSGIEVRTSRPIMRNHELFVLRLRESRSALFSFVPRRIRRRIRTLFAAQ